MSIFEPSSLKESKKIVITALMVSVGIVLQIVESMFDIFAVPGGKLGLSNVATLVDIFILGGGNGVLVAFLRSFLGCILYGGVPAMPYSVCGAVFSALCMWGLKSAFYPKLSHVGISVLGAFVHNTAQIAVAVAIFKSTSLLSYLPVLVIIGTIGGAATGYGAKIFCQKAGITEQ